MLAIKAEIVSEPVDIDTPCWFIARTINRNTRDSLIVATIYRPTNNDVDYAKALYNTIKSLCLKYPKSTMQMILIYQTLIGSQTHSAVTGT
jgi:hypothetical protein